MSSFFMDSRLPGLATAATDLTHAFHSVLQDFQKNMNLFPNIDVRIFDAYALLNKIITNLDDYGIEVTDVLCIKLLKFFPRPDIKMNTIKNKRLIASRMSTFYCIGYVVQFRSIF
ncbi:MAG: phospholipase/lecithinase/hemolysin [Psychromonas sp.]|jgi:phospholipase/lecithinase/hemolysin